MRLRLACIDMPAMAGMPAAAMGIRYVNGGLGGDPDVDPAKPAAVIYEPEKNGQLRLVALEYVTSSPNRFGLDPFYSLHAWIWKDNPDGMFSMFNPDVSCAHA